MSLLCIKLENELTLRIIIGSRWVKFLYLIQQFYIIKRTLLSNLHLKEDIVTAHSLWLLPVTSVLLWANVFCFSTWSMDVLCLVFCLSCLWAAPSSHPTPVRHLLISAFIQSPPDCCAKSDSISNSPAWKPAASQLTASRNQLPHHTRHTTIPVTLINFFDKLPACPLFAFGFSLGMWQYDPATMIPANLNPVCQAVAT